VSGQPDGVPAGDGPRRLDRLSLVVGILFVLAGVVFLLDALDVWRLRGDYLVPLGLILLGLAVLASGLPVGSRRS
jgi:Na+/phosphate symporter